ncbi:hypothetical protein A3A09_01475 [Candidatus Nomurabacteria bacterium RIFCSPLOWO2_01_FULL_42_20]|uniref:Penicillin-binding protein 2 n=1 Tax=Candidatus Nomurabacteria bacterium RIFCSPHIGHO2_01_FULL_42_16 TaxID=1801743 RepID=A0A1F6VJS0_9BACT|nr:MAG: hypothetical protein A2824_02045 [Candidatus Nomurabacteria bacterium RIFCSPHIGHO2_01_FULL_42_16]OGI91704.1 MAG: hypothetical protein A3A09_01475 [Candidatus Nomurabacteria bacterium RIFCSPLOWO2_01_FULL_42_20]
MLNKHRRIKNWDNEIEPDEIFLDSENIPAFNRQQFEGRLEKPITKRTIFFLAAVFLIIIFAFTWRVFDFQVVHGAEYTELSQNISLDHQIVFADRGIIYDRNHIPLAYNELNERNQDFSKRVYISKDGFGHLLGYIGYPLKDQVGFYWQKEFKGIDGIEKEYNVLLNGQNGVKVIEVNVRGEIQSENVLTPPRSGESLTLAVDSRIQAELFRLIKKWSDTANFKGGSGVIMDVKTGEILAITNFPEYNSSIISEGKEGGIIEGYLSDSRKPFLNRALSGLYTPGSIVKPFIALGALKEGVIDQNKKILSTGSISIPNPYFPELKSVFRDWKAHGWVDMRRALAVSSDVYFYEIGGGFEDQRGLGISNIEKYVRMFGVGEKTGIDLPGEVSGIIPTPEWKKKVFPNDPWRIGDTYNTSIGQYGFQITPVEAARSAAAVGNGGKILQPRLVRDDNLSLENTRDLRSAVVRLVDIEKEFFDVVKEGMRMTATVGTAPRLNLPFVKVAAKTGTAQVGAKNQFMNSWVIGFFPYDSPRYAFAVILDGAPKTNSIGASNIMADLLEWMNLNTPEYF